jgi:hypothetical protein
MKFELAKHLDKARDTVTEVDRVVSLHSCPSDTRNGSHHCWKQNRSSRRGEGNTTRVALTGPMGNERRTKSLVNSRLAANSRAQQLPVTHFRDGTETGDRSIPGEANLCLD